MCFVFLGRQKIMPKIIEITKYEDFKECLKKYDKNDFVYCYFFGSKDRDGISWCRDCEISESHILAAIKKYANQRSIIIFADVGVRKCWKDVRNPFRTDRCIRLTVVPTILRWKHPHRLEGAYYCAKDDILEVFFTYEIDK